MKILLKSVCYFVALIFLLRTSFVCAAEDFNTWKQTFRSEALAEGVNVNTLNKFLPQMTLLPDVVRSDKKQPEFLSSFWEYVDARLTDSRISEGQTMKGRYKTWLAHVSEQYGVPAAYILALWGLETNYGKVTGNTDVLNALATLAYNLRRRRFFTRELIAFLKILEKEPWTSVKGSWAGAFGQFQFMPTTFEAYAVDADGNGTRNIITSMPDAFASAANYLHQMGWNPEESWGLEVELPEKLDWKEVHASSTKPVKEWEAMGIHPVRGRAWQEKERDLQAALLLPMGKEGPAFLTLPNFRRIMRWNKSELYALSVCFLSDILSDRWQGIVHPRTNKRLSTQKVYEIQQYLADLGYDLEKPDGLVGSKTRRAILAFQRDKGVDEDGYPSEELLELLKTYRKELK